MPLGAMLHGRPNAACGRRARLLLPLLAALTPGAASCATDAALRVEKAPTLPPGPKRVSVFSVYRNGRLDTSWWDRLAPSLAAEFGAGRCALGFDEPLRRAAPALYEKIDSVSKDEGVTPELLAEVVGRADGEYLLVITAFGRVPGGGHPDRPRRPGSLASSSGMAPSASGPFMGGGGRRGGRGRPGGVPKDDRPAEEPFELTALLYTAAALPAQVLKVSLRYAGRDYDEALQQFAQALHAAAGDATCASWR